MTAKEYIAHYNLLPHPEGGYFREMYRSHESIQFPEFDGPRNYCTSIYFLLEKDQISALHRIKSDEIWFFHDGGTLIITEMDEQGQTIETKLGKNGTKNERLQHVVRAGRWFGAHVLDGEFVLVGCSVSPGFDFKDFELK
jgi:predicted cupin superfamily sugar epimerase